MYSRLCSRPCAYTALEDQKFFLCQLTFKGRGTHKKQGNSLLLGCKNGGSGWEKRQVELAQSSLKRLLSGGDMSLDLEVTRSKPWLGSQTRTPGGGNSKGMGAGKN